MYTYAHTCIHGVCLHIIPICIYMKSSSHFFGYNYFNLLHIQDYNIAYTLISFNDNTYNLSMEIIRSKMTNADDSEADDSRNI